MTTDTRPQDRTPETLPAAAPSAVLEDVAFETIRRKGVGGSDVPAILGVSKFRTPHDVFLDKMGLSIREENDAMYWGKVLEPFVLTEYERRVGVKVQRLPFPQGFRRHPRRDWMIGNLDALVIGSPVGVDAKTTDARNADDWGQEGTDEIPADALLQMQWYLAILEDLERFDVAVLIGGRVFRTYAVRPNRDLQTFLVETCGEWWERYVLTKTAPPVDGSEAARKMIERLYPQATAGVIRGALPDEEALAYAYKEANEALDGAFSRRDLIKNAICAAIGDDVGLDFDGGRVTWKKTKDGTKVDWETIARALAPLLAQVPGSPTFEQLVQAHTTPTPGVRRFLMRYED